MFFISAFPVGLFFFLHVALLAAYSVFLVLMHSGKETIERKDAEIKQKVSILRMMQADIESVRLNHPEHDKIISKVAEALKYSDPMSNPVLSVYEEEIQRSIISLSGIDGNGTTNIPEICEKLLKQIADRNNRVKLMK